MECSILLFTSSFRPGLEPPLLQQAAFDELVYEVDIMRNMATRHTQDEKEAQEKEAFRRPSLPVGSKFIDEAIGTIAVDFSCSDQG